MRVRVGQHHPSDDRVIIQFEFNEKKVYPELLLSMGYPAAISQGVQGNEHHQCVRVHKELALPLYEALRTHLLATGRLKADASP